MVPTIFRCCIKGQGIENYKFAVLIIILGGFSVLSDFSSRFRFWWKFWPVFRFLIGLREYRLSRIMWLFQYMERLFFRRVYPTVVSVFHIYRRKLPHRCTLATSSISEISVLLISMQTHLPRCCTSARSCSILENLLNNTLRSWRILSRQQSHIICVCLITASIWIVSLQYFLRVSSWWFWRHTERIFSMRSYIIYSKW